MESERTHTNSQEEQNCSTDADQQIPDGVSRQWQRFPPRGTAVNYCKAAANAPNGELHEIAEFFLKNVFLKKFPAL